MNKRLSTDLLVKSTNLIKKFFMIKMWVKQNKKLIGFSLKLAKFLYKYISWCHRFRLLWYMVFFLNLLFSMVIIVIYVTWTEVKTLLTRSFSTRVKYKKVPNITRYNSLWKRMSLPFTIVQIHVLKNRVPLWCSVERFSRI